ncbi:glycosyltransferase family 4 protein [Candidatus Hecatella orcuttiae]|jgi:glycosyltransferase involved in cell wall biosynthesis|uniref:glycosyltransferase family 4 protein n=1 Tax=Candidatus Hecatella orcuttiae TaxID=1935119 RepID=UPI0028682E3F|nr:glycosyltransferase family 4 protein [Candidatus Hecatella orcuttiae]
MEICAVSQSFYPYAGGVSYYLLWLGRKLRKQGHKLYVVHLRPLKAPAKDVVEDIKVYRVPETSLDPRIVSGYTRFKELILKVFHGEESSEEKLINKHLYGFNEYFAINKMFADKISELYDETGFDLLHVHDFQVLLMGSMLRELKIPKVFTWHIPFTEEVPKRWREFIVQHMQEYDRVVLSTRVYVSTALQSGLSWDKVRCIYPFVAVEKVKVSRFRKKYGLSREEKIILCVARIDQFKGQDILIKALPRILEKEPHVRCVFVGNGSMTKDVLKASEKKQYEERLKSLIHEMNLKDHVIFTGHISRSDLMQAYKACDVVVLPSIMEGFGLAITEGMAFGKPVIGSAVGGIKSQIWPGVNGYLVEAGNVTQLAEALVKVLSDKELKEKLGRRAREIYERNYSVARGVKDNIELYEDILGYNWKK